MKRAKIHWTLVSTLTLVLAQGGTGCLGERRPKPRTEQKADVPDAGATVEAVSLEGIDDTFTKLVEGGERKQVLYGREHPQKGAAQPLVTIVEFSDFQCPFCGRLAGSLDQLLADDPDVRLVFKQFPLPMHPDAEPGARAALAAGAQGKYWEMHDLLFANPRRMTASDLEEHAKSLGLDLAKFKADMDSDELRKQVEDDMDQGRTLGVSSTPTFFVNGRQVTGAQPLEEIQKIVDEEKARARKLLEAGADRSKLYAYFMKAAGASEQP